MSPVGVARHNQWRRRTGPIHQATRPIDPHNYLTQYGAVCGASVEHALPVPTDAGPCCPDCWATPDETRRTA